METKEQLLTALRDEFDRWEELLAGLREQQIVAPQLPSNLSIKDVMAHLHAWQQLSIARLDAALRHQQPEFRLEPEGLDPDAEENLERINAWIHETNRSKPWSSVYQEWRAGFLQFIALARAIPEQDLLQAAKYLWLEGYPLSAIVRASFEHHHDEHLGPLLAWLQQHPDL